MNIPRREFLALLPPVPAGFKQILTSPKDSDHTNKRMRKAGAMPRASVSLAQTNAAGMSITRIAVQNNQVILDWVSGTPPFDIESKIDSGPWTKQGNSTLAQTATRPTQGDHALLRIKDNSQQVLTVFSNPNGTAHLSWTVPDLE